MLEFKDSKALTLGVELELQIVNTRNFDLTKGSQDILSLLAREKHGFDIKPEVTESMIEIATGIHQNIATLEEELNKIKSLLTEVSEKLNLGLCGGGTHPFQHWAERKIYPAERYALVSEIYGYLIKQFTVYGQHIHIGCVTGDLAIGLANYLTQHIPHFIALSASSPFYQGIDTSFKSSRLNSISAFPMSGVMTNIKNWDEFNNYFSEMQQLGVVQSMKDFYWDIRPKPEFGTVEIRVCDTPLTIHRACLIAAYAQMLASHFFTRSLLELPVKKLALTYNYNKFQASRYGFNGLIIKSNQSYEQVKIKDDILNTLQTLKDDAEKLGLQSQLKELEEISLKENCDADWIRAEFERSENFSSVVEQSCGLWRDSVRH
uniref:YbdK family carboxylate-amine ligase n=1 Tax=Polynucleobacter sp. TaxID=2029855 RepID=UPI004048258C